MKREEKKKEEEKKIISMIFKREIIEKVEFDETPDFVVTDKNGLKVGFEVTKIFPNQAQAINFNDKSFNDRFIKDYSKKKKKKREQEIFKNLSIIEVVGDAVVPGPTVLFKASLKEFFDFFLKIVEEKSKNYLNLRDDIISVSLIAYDITNYLKIFKMEPGKLYLLIRQHPLYNSVLNSPFQEIILISHLEKGYYSIDLKRLIFISEFAIFHEHWKKLSIEDSIKNNLLTKMNNFLICQLFLGFKNLYLSSDENNLYVFFGNTYWKINKEDGELQEVQLLSLDYNQLKRAEIQLRNWGNYRSTFENYLKFRENFNGFLESGYFSFHENINGL